MIIKRLTFVILTLLLSQTASAAIVSYSSGPYSYSGGFDEQGSYGVGPTTVTGLQQFDPS